MNEEQIDILANASQVFIILASVAKNNPAIKLPNSDQFNKIAEDLMNIIRSNKKV